MAPPLASSVSLLIIYISVPVYLYYFSGPCVGLVGPASAAEFSRCTGNAIQVDQRES